MAKLFYFPAVLTAEESGILNELLLYQSSLLAIQNKPEAEILLNIWQKFNPGQECNISEVIALIKKPAQSRTSVPEEGSVGLDTSKNDYHKEVLYPVLDE